MVKAADIEGLLRRYVEDKDLERADALSLIYTAPKDEAAKTLNARYGRRGAISSVIGDLKNIGVKRIERYERTEDTDEPIEIVVKDAFKSLCLNLVKEAVRVKKQQLGRKARELLYTVLLLYSGEEFIKRDALRAAYYVLFREMLTRSDMDSLANELRIVHVVHYISGDYIYLSPLFAEIIQELKDIMPIVEIRISWPSEEVKGV
ncbi:MAG: hypothetical protein DRJ69_05930 [Thermoprotei archaeon]|nr:MAG: hypothetical protein DRJ69_05930 [Thermoprotei archaeon]